jgi:hypothetical protein
MRADDRMEDRRPVAILGIEQRRGLPPAAIGEGAPPALEPASQFRIL